MATTDRDLTVINSMTETQLNSLKDASGKIPSLANQLIMTPDNNEGYIAGNGLILDGNTFEVDTEVIQEKLTAGQNITIENNVISASGGGSADVAEAVKDQKTQQGNKEWTGTLAEYNAITTKDPNTFYYITDDAGGAGGGGGSSINYSTEEQLTGDTWIDGKPLYRKTLVYIGQYKGNYSLAHNISDIDTIMLDQSASLFNIAAAPYNETTPAPYVHTNINTMAGLFLKKTTIELRIGSNNTLYRAIITVKYTKTQ